MFPEDLPNWDSLSHIMGNLFNYNFEAIPMEFSYQLATWKKSAICYLINIHGQVFEFTYSIKVASSGMGEKSIHREQFEQLYL